MNCQFTKGLFKYSKICQSKNITLHDEWSEKLSSYYSSYIERVGEYNEHF